MVQTCQMANRVREQRKSRKVTLDQMAEETSISQSYLSRIEKGERGLSLENAVKIARCLKVEVADLTDDYGVDDIEIAERTSLAPTDVKRVGFDIGHADIHAGMGFGGAVEGIGEDEIVDGWHLPQTVKSGRRNLGTMRSIEVRGESMEPDIKGGSWVLVDTTQKIPEDDIYALDYGEGLLVKQVNLVPLTDEIDIVSKNPEHPNHRLKRADVRIHGRVVGCFYWRG